MIRDGLQARTNDLEGFIRSERRHLFEKVCLLSAIERRFGYEIRETIRETKANMVLSQWMKVGDELRDRAIRDLMQILWEPMRERGIVDFDKICEDERIISLRVTKCIFAELVIELGISKEWGYDLYCSDDEHIVNGFNPKIKFSRSKTLMEGHDCCNHCYQI